MVFTQLYNPGREAEDAQTYEKCSNFSIFSRLSSFPQVFGQAQEYSILKLHEMIRMSQIFACPIIFTLVCDLGRYGGVLEHIKNDQFQVFSAVVVVSSTFWAGLGADHTVFYKNCESIFYYCVLNGFYCALKSTSAKWSAET